jgi:hypothetical protein
MGALSIGCSHRVCGSDAQRYSLAYRRTRCGGPDSAWFVNDLVPHRGIWYALIAALAGIAMTLAANFAVVGRLAWTPGGYGIVFGRMLQDGIVDRYLDDHCHEMRLKLCPFHHQLPHDANAFLWVRAFLISSADSMGWAMKCARSCLEVSQSIPPCRRRQR